MLTVELTHTDTASVPRFYRISVAVDLFDASIVTREWGAVGTAGARRAEAFDDLEEAFKYGMGLGRRLIAAGYSQSSPSAPGNAQQDAGTLHSYCRDELRARYDMAMLLKQFLNIRITNECFGNVPDKRKEVVEPGCLSQRVNITATEMGVTQLIPPKLDGFLNYDLFSYFSRERKLRPLARNLARNGIFFVGDIVCMSPEQFRQAASASTVQIAGVKERLLQSGLSFNSMQPRWKRPAPPMLSMR